MDTVLNDHDEQQASARNAELAARQAQLEAQRQARENAILVEIAQVKAEQALAKLEGDEDKVKQLDETLKRLSLELGQQQVQPKAELPEIPSPPSSPAPTRRQ